jgi:WhiB family transcriptional regulator, redox-sensing transcriptional regulator
MTVDLHNDRIFTARITLDLPPAGAWSERAACVGLPTELFVPDGFKESPTREARAICDACPVKNDCLETALRDSSLVGLWGGTTPRVRDAIRRRRGIRGSDGRQHDTHLVACGTPSAKRRHQRRGETCTACDIKETA